MIPIHSPRRAMLGAAAGLATAALARPALAQGQWTPDRPIRFIVGFAAGGPTGVLDRRAAQGFQEILGGPVVVENRPGAAGNIGSEFVVRAPADELTLLIANSGQVVINPQTYARMSVNPMTGLVPVSKLTTGPFLFAVNGQMGVSTHAELVALLKRRPGEFEYASTGLGGITHVVTEMWRARVGVETEPVHFRGTAASIPDVLANRTPMFFDGIQMLGQHVRSGALRAMLRPDATRSPVMPEVPSSAEAGVADFNVQSWFAIYAPRGTPRPALRPPAGTAMLAGPTGETGGMTQQAPLAGIRVLEIGTGFALAYCGKLFVDFGAEVVKAEPPGGDPLRRAPPLLMERPIHRLGEDAAADRTPEGQSALFAWLTTNRRSITTADLAPWLAGADVLLDGRPPGARTPIPGEDDAGLIRCDLSWFGETGPYAHFAGTDAVARALAGVFFCTGPVDGPPMVLDGFPGETLTGLAAGIATLSALLSRAAGGRRLEANLLETNLAVSEYYVTQALLTPGLVRRQGRDRFFPTWPMGVYPCAEGSFLGVSVVTPAQWRGFCEMLGLPALGADPDLVVGPNRIARLAEIEAAFAPRLLARRAEAWHAECLERRLPCAVVPDMATLLRTEQHRGRGAFAEVSVPGARFEAPVLPHRLPRTPPAAGGVSPRLGADDAAAPPPPRTRPGRRATTPPLDGVTILDLSMGWAGPLCTRMLGDLGATILKVEAIQYPDWWRGLDPRPAFFAEKQYETNPRYNALNRNKSGITLDLSNPEGAALLKRLVAQCDAVVENYAREVLPKLGLGYDALSAARPDLVMVSMPAFGAAGPWRDARAYGSTLEHASGLPSVAGEDGTPPVTSHLAFGDPVGGYNAATATLLALLHRQRSGQGQHVDLAQVECIMQFTAPWLIAQSLAEAGTGAPLPRLGNRHPVHVPQGCFPCAGEDRWIVVAVTDDAAWRGLCGVIGAAGLGDLDAAARRARQAELEALITAWTRGQDADVAMTALQAAGVAAGVCRNPIHLMADAQLVARGVFQPIERAFVGRHLQLSAPFRDAGAGPLPVRRAAPTLGEDNAAVLGGRLGLKAAELARLAAAGVIGTEAVPISARRSRASTG